MLMKETNQSSLSRTTVMEEKRVVLTTKVDDIQVGNDPFVLREIIFPYFSYLHKLALYRL